jgi:hypothetical protein
MEAICSISESSSLKARLAWAALSLLAFLTAQPVVADPAPAPTLFALDHFTGEEAAALQTAESSTSSAILPRETTPPGPTRPTGPEASTEMEEAVSGTGNAYPALRSLSAPSAESRFADQPLYCIHKSYLI